ncbi:MAG: Ig-like domain-containing protein [Limisphaerales bacterium]
MAFTCSTYSYAIEPRDYAVEASVEVLANPFALRLTWVPNDAGASYTIRRRTFGATEWGNGASLPGAASEFTDNEVTEGVAYEYEIRLETTVRGAGGWVNAYGYLLAGANISWPDQKGKVLLVVEATVASSLSAEVDAFQRDLLGAGWFPIRRDLPRLSSVSEVKNLIRAEYNADPANLRSVILLGRVPVPYSGNIAPDLHESHRGAWPADVFYADVDGNWTDNIVDIVSGDYSANDNRIGDGKFDQSQIPSKVELEIGRIDFYDMPAFGPRTPHDLLRNYLRKNSEFRHRLFTANRRMLVRDNFGDLSGDSPAVDAWRHYRQMFGAGTIQEVGPNAFFPTLQNESYLWAYGGGGGGNTKADTVGTTTDFASQNPQAVFMILHGSYFGDWNTKDNFIRAAIGTQNYTLASMWSGLPHWFMHPMALGRSIGDSTRLTQNNVSDYKSHLNYSAQQVHISLIGDPTLENFPVIPPRNLTGSDAGNINLTWSPSLDQNIVGYQVYHSTSANGPFQKLTAAPILATAYSHAIGMGAHHYMVRAVKRERTGSGSFFNLSQGLFTSVTKSSGGAIPQVNIAVDDGTAGETGADNGSFRITRSFADENPLTVDLLMGGTAQNGIDYLELGTSVVIPAWETNRIIMVVPVAENLVEEGETVTIQIRSSASYTIGSPSSAVITIADGVNSPPTITQIADQGIEAGLSSGDLAFQVGDLETPASNLQITGVSSNEQLVPPTGIIFGGGGANRTVRINTAGGTNGIVSITLTVSDGVNQATSIFEVEITPKNRPPTALGAEIQTLEDEPVEITLAGIDPDNDVLEFEIVLPPTKGGLTGAGNSFVYHPSSNAFGLDSFTFRVRDDEFVSPEATVSLTIAPVNDVPVAKSSVVQLLEDEVFSFVLSGSDPDDDSISYLVVSLPTNGVLSGTVPNLVYKPATNFHGEDVARFVVHDGAATSAVASITFTVHPVNDAPVLSPQTVATVEDSSVNISVVAADPDGEVIMIRVAVPPENGFLTGTPPNFIYTPNSDFNGEDAFTLVANDGMVDSPPVTIRIQVELRNDPPVIAALEPQRARKNSTIGPLPLSVMDPDGAVGELNLRAESSNPTLIPPNQIVFASNVTNRQVTLFPNSGVVGDTVITIIVFDGGATAQTSFLLSITNTPPVPGDDLITAGPGQITIPIAQLLANDQDADGDTLRVISVAQSDSGRAVMLTNDTVIYYGSTNILEDSFSYTVEDTSSARASAIVSLRLTAAPRINSITVASGSVILQISGPPIRDFQVLRSEDGVTWELLGGGTSDSKGIGEFNESGDALKQHRFYRVEWP